MNINLFSILKETYGVLSLQLELLEILLMFGGDKYNTKIKRIWFDLRSCAAL